MCIYWYKLIFCKKVTFVEIVSYNLLALMGRIVYVSQKTVCIFKTILEYTKHSITLQQTFCEYLLIYHNRVRYYHIYGACFGYVSWNRFEIFPHIWCMFWLCISKSFWDIPTYMVCVLVMNLGIVGDITTYMEELVSQSMLN